MNDIIVQHSVISGVHAQGAAPDTLFSECDGERMLNANNLLSNGFGLNPKSIWFTDELSFHEKVILQYLLSYMGGDQHRAWPSLSTIAKHLGKSSDGPGMGKASIVKGIRGLCSKGAISKGTRKNENGSFSNIYECNLKGGSVENQAGSGGNRGGSVENLNINMNINKNKNNSTTPKSPIKDNKLTYYNFENIRLTEDQFSHFAGDMEKRWGKDNKWVYLYASLERANNYYEKNKGGQNLTLAWKNWIRDCVKYPMSEAMYKDFERREKENK